MAIDVTAYTGSQCVNGGLAVTTGVDDNNDGNVDDAGATTSSTTYVCNGTDGTNGTALAASNVTVVKKAGPVDLLLTASCPTTAVLIGGGCDGGTNYVRADYASTPGLGGTWTCTSYSSIASAYAICLTL